MLNFFNRNAGSIQAISAMLTVLLALAALVGIKVQIDAADKLQRAQSARDIYREYLNLAINKPEFSQPEYCKIAGTQQEAAYSHFVEYLLYTAEQTTAIDESWAETFAVSLADHKQYICSIDETSGYSEQVAAMISAFQAKSCQNLPDCADALQ